MITLSLDVLFKSRIENRINTTNNSLKLSNIVSAIFFKYNLFISLFFLCSTFSLILSLSDKGSFQNFFIVMAIQSIFLYWISFKFKEVKNKENHLKIEYFIYFASPYKKICYIFLTILILLILSYFLKIETKFLVYLTLFINLFLFIVSLATVLLIYVCYLKNKKIFFFSNQLTILKKLLDEKNLLELEKNNLTAFENVYLQDDEFKEILRHELLKAIDLVIYNPLSKFNMEWKKFLLNIYDRNL